MKNEMQHKLEEYKIEDVREFCALSGLGFVQEKSGICNIYMADIFGKLQYSELLYAANNLKEVDAYAAGYLCAKREFIEEEEEW